MKNFKSISEQLADKLIVHLEKYVNSKSTEPYAAIQLTGPAINAATGKNYKGLNAIWLAMQGREDPRWATLRQARMNKWEVDKSAKPSMISFNSYSDSKPLLDEDGKKLKDENGKTRYERIKRPQPVEEKAWVFNGSQVKGMPTVIELFSSQIADQDFGTKQADKLLAYSGAIFAEGSHYGYDLKTDRIVRSAERLQAADELKHAIILKDLAHWTGHESRLNRNVHSEPGTAGYAAENLKGMLSTMLFSTELGLPYGFEMEHTDAKHLLSHLKNDPDALKVAMEDAKHIVSYVKELYNAEIMKPKIELIMNKDKFSLGEQIPYKDKMYEVIKLYKNGRVEIQDQDSKQKIKMNKNDGLYSSLLEARESPIEKNNQRSIPLSKVEPPNAGIPVIPQEEQLSSNLKMKR